MRQKLLFVFLFFPLFGMTQTANISGVVTYFFNDNLGDKPDIGAKVYLIDSMTNTIYNGKTVDSFLYVKTYRGIYQTYLKIFSDYDGIAKSYEGKKKHKEDYETFKAKAENAKKDVDEYYAKLFNYGVETEEKFNQLDRRTAETIVRVNEDNSALKTVDGGGNYNFTTKPGTYYIFIISKGRTGLSISEIMGKIYSKKIILKANDTKTVSKNFDLN